MKTETKKRPQLTAAQATAAEFLLSEGYVIAGKSERNGAVVRFSAQTLKALARRGYGDLRISPDGGVMLRGRSFDAGKGVRPWQPFVAKAEVSR